ncbi:MAG: hypothetical protein Unbinned3891contig1000_1 [Prokaryotic dsDNA virus sp.]|nr:MAG: hypothetical protein Unbinned3891contig1000_1 [Prokaryotic dsDNA virus sp.]|tara:strand:- start:28530 stop:29231 length:702 start_codon:yes stop_codon:yes gene_type:complete
MSKQLITVGADRRCDLKLAEAIRKPVWGDDWNSVRIGLQGTLSGADSYGSSLLGSPVFAFGVCAGKLSGYGFPDTVHCVGARTTQSSWGWNAGPPGYFDISNVAAEPIPFKKVGETVTDASNQSDGSDFPADEDVRCGWFIDILKGSPNYSITVGRPENATASQSDLTDAEFLSIMDLDFGLSGITSVKSGYHARSYTLAVEEESDGVLDHIFIHWSKTVVGFSFNVRHRKFS